MRITKIIAYPDKIEVCGDDSFPTCASGKASVPLVQGKIGRRTPSRTVVESCQIENGRIVFPRYAEDYDLSICRFEVFADGEQIDGVRYVTDLSSGFAKGEQDLSPKAKPVGTWVTCS